MSAWSRSNLPQIKMEEYVNVLYVPKTMVFGHFTYPRGVYLAKVLVNLTKATVNVNVSVHFSEGSDLFHGFAHALLAD